MGWYLTVLHTFEIIISLYQNKHWWPCLVMPLLILFINLFICSVYSYCMNLFVIPAWAISLPCQQRSPSPEYCLLLVHFMFAHYIKSIHIHEHSRSLAAISVWIPSLMSWVSGSITLFDLHFAFYRVLSVVWLRTAILDFGLCCCVHSHWAKMHPKDVFWMSRWKDIPWGARMKVFMTSFSWCLLNVQCCSPQDLFTRLKMSSNLVIVDVFNIDCWLILDIIYTAFGPNKQSHAAFN